MPQMQHDSRRGVLVTSEPIRDAERGVCVGLVGMAIGSGATYLINTALHPGVTRITLAFLILIFLFLVRLVIRRRNRGDFA